MKGRYVVGIATIYPQHQTWLAAQEYLNEKRSDLDPRSIIQIVAPDQFSSEWRVLYLWDSQEKVCYVKPR